MRKTTAARNADAQAEKKERIKALTDKLENGVKEVFESEAYKEYLKTMSKFHRYSFGNCMLIFFPVSGRDGGRRLHDMEKAGPHGQKGRAWNTNTRPMSVQDHD